MKFLLALLAVLAVACIIAGQVCEQAKAPCDCGKAQPTPIKCQGGQTCDPTGGNTNDGACTDPANSGGSGIPPAPQVCTGATSGLKRRLRQQGHLRFALRTHPGIGSGFFWADFGLSRTGLLSHPFAEVVRLSDCFSKG